MEIKTCEEYVLNELDRTQKELEETKNVNKNLKLELFHQSDDIVDYIQYIKFLFHRLENPMEIKDAGGVPYFQLGKEFISLKVSWLKQDDVEKIEKCVKIMELVDSKEKEDIINKLKEVLEEYENQKELKQEDK